MILVYWFYKEGYKRYWFDMIFKRYMQVIFTKINFNHLYEENHFS